MEVHTLLRPAKLRNTILVVTTEYSFLRQVPECTLTSLPFIFEIHLNYIFHPAQNRGVYTRNDQSHISIILCWRLTTSQLRYVLHWLSIHRCPNTYFVMAIAIDIIVASTCYLGVAMALPTKWRKSALSSSSVDFSPSPKSGLCLVFHNQNNPRTASWRARLSSS